MVTMEDLRLRGRGHHASRKAGPCLERQGGCILIDVRNITEGDMTCTLMHTPVSPLL